MEARHVACSLPWHYCQPLGSHTEAGVRNSPYLLDVPYLSIMKVWYTAGLDFRSGKLQWSTEWLWGCIKLGKHLTKWKLRCPPCAQPAVGSLSHYLVYCPYIEDIRLKYVRKFIIANTRAARLSSNEAALRILILDPDLYLLLVDIRYLRYRKYTLSHVNTICTTNLKSSIKWKVDQWTVKKKLLQLHKS